MFFLSRFNIDDEHRYAAWLKIFGVFFGLSLALNLVIWALILTQIGKFDLDIPLHYNIYFGIDDFGSKNNLFFLPIFASLVLIVNFLVSFYFANKEKFLTYFLLGASIFIQILVLLASLSILTLNQSRL